MFDPEKHFYQFNFSLEPWCTLVGTPWVLRGDMQRGELYVAYRDNTGMEIASIGIKLTDQQWEEALSLMQVDQIESFIRVREEHEEYLAWSGYREYSTQFTAETLHREKCVKESIGVIYTNPPIIEKKACASYGIPFGVRFFRSGKSANKQAPKFTFDFEVTPENKGKIESPLEYFIFWVENTFGEKINTWINTKMISHINEQCDELGLGKKKREALLQSYYEKRFYL